MVSSLQVLLRVYFASLFRIDYFSANKHLANRFNILALVIQQHVFYLYLWLEFEKRQRLYVAVKILESDSGAEPFDYRKRQFIFTKSKKNFAVFCLSILPLAIF